MKTLYFYWSECVGFWEGEKRNNLDIETIDYFYIVRTPKIKLFKKRLKTDKNLKDKFYRVAKKVEEKVNRKVFLKEFLDIIKNINIRNSSLFKIKTYLDLNMFPDRDIYHKIKCRNIKVYFRLFNIYDEFEQFILAVHKTKMHLKYKLFDTNILRVIKGYII